jgi:hypothetical protein
VLSRIWLFSLILGVPLVGFAIAEGVQVHFNSQSLGMGMASTNSPLDTELGRVSTSVSISSP